MKELCFTEVQRNLANLLDEVASGETIKIVRRDHPSAYLVNGRDYRAFIAHKQNQIPGSEKR